MKVLVFGSNTYDNYNELIRQLTVLIDDRKHFFPDDREYTFIHSGSRGAETMVTEYIGKVEKYLLQKGYKIKEQLVRGNILNGSIIKDMPDFVLIFGDSAKNRSYLPFLELWGIPHRYIKD